MTREKWTGKGKGLPKAGGAQKKAVSSIWNIPICRTTGLIILDFEPEQSSNEPYYRRCRIENGK